VTEWNAFAFRKRCDGASVGLLPVARFARGNDAEGSGLLRASQLSAPTMPN